MFALMFSRFPGEKLHSDIGFSKSLIPLIISSVSHISIAAGHPGPTGP